MEDMNSDGLHPCELLRTIDTLYEPDVRHGYFSRFDSTIGNFRPGTAAEHLEEVASFTLGADVPQSIQIHFETAKNLYAYAWFVYRFYPVAEQQALTSLEFALRERLAAEIGQSLPVEAKLPRGLSRLLKQALERGAISNDRFSWTRERALRRARQRAELERIHEMQRSGLTTCKVDHSNVVPLPEDFDDWIEIFIDTLPKVRNMYAHGSGALHNTVLHTFEIVSELINQLFVPAR
ncbi:hypothetical protein ACSC95_00245 [Burkholderia vietnamiensis]|uniref:hypothetical protein n=1 Tax=Burkholderia vietnamiensis TaxID=60552 RepID=UPI000F80BD50|nr:hypothetical protein [Burkholderia vietnamiensis]MBR8010401.1 hypothetical protein [Burkholderia vietnamiensis]MDN8042728.1 hypothetical protein [Burkholderia vietnamiensis]HDR9135009.1 hypothetical protein [Burkholderia vietnamiensis]